MTPFDQKRLEQWKEFYGLYGDIGRSKEDIEEFWLQALKKQRASFRKELEKTPLFDFSESGIKGDFYLKKDDLLSSEILKEDEN